MTLLFRPSIQESLKRIAEKENTSINSLYAQRWKVLLKEHERVRKMLSILAKLREITQFWKSSQDRLERIEEDYKDSDPETITKIIKAEVSGPDVSAHSRTVAE